MNELEVRRVRTSRPEQVTVGQWLTTYREFFPGAASAETIRHDLQMVAPFSRRYGKRLLSEVTPLQAQAWALQHPGQVKWLRHAWGKAVLMGMTGVNVWRLVELPPRDTPDRVPPSQEQLDAIVLRCLAEFSFSSRRRWWEDFADMILLAAYSGARLGGIANLRRSEVDLDAGRVILHEKGSKTRTAALLGLSRDAVERALRRPRTLDGLLFTAPNGRPLDRRLIAERWGLVRGEFPHGFHSLRHFAATWLSGRGADPLDVAVQLGHTDRLGRPYDRLVQRTYNHPEPETALSRLQALTPDQDRGPR